MMTWTLDTRGMLALTDMPLWEPELMNVIIDMSYCDYDVDKILADIHEEVRYECGDFDEDLYDSRCEWREIALEFALAELWQYEDVLRAQMMPGGEITKHEYAVRVLEYEY